MNIFGSSTSAGKLEAQLKQKTVQMDNLDSTLIATKRELAQERRDRETAEQELASRAKFLNELEDQNNKLTKLLKQKSEYAFSLSSQIEAKARELQHHEDLLHQEKARSFHTTKELQESLARQKALEHEIARVNSTASLAERTYRAAQSERGKEISGLSEELVSAHHSLEAQQAQLASFEAKVQNGQLDTDNRMHSMDSLKAKVLSLENQLMAERASAQKKLQQLGEACEDASREAKERGRETEQLQAAVEVKDAKISTLSDQKLAVEAQLQAASAHSSHGKVDKKTHEEVLEAKGQLKQHVQDLQRRLKDSEQAVAEMQSKLAAAATELDDVRAQVESGKSSSESRDTAVANMQMALSKHQKEAEAAATAHAHQLAQAVADLEASERTVADLRSTQSQLEHERDTLSDKLRRGAEAVSKTATLREKLEAKLAKLAADKTAAEEDAAAAKATATQLERDMVELQRCSAKNAQDRDEARRAVGKLESEVGDLRGRVAEHDLARSNASHHVLAAPNSDGGRNYAALREQCLAKEAEVTSVKSELADVKKQLKEERGKREEAKSALISEQQYFASKLAELEGMTRGSATGTPGSQVHNHIQRMKKQLQAVGDGGDVAHVAKRTMLTPSQPVPPARPPSRSPLTPKTTLSQPRLSSDASPARSATPRSGKGLTAQDSAQYWHRRYEEQSSKLSQLESAHRSLKVQLLRSGGTVGSVAFASVRTPSAKTPTLGQVSATPPTRTETCSQPTAGLNVRRELDFSNSEAASANVGAEDLSRIGQENSGGFGSVSPALALTGSES
eukprot:jgi/Ulvmu1/1471/UM011_0201.1